MSFVFLFCTERSGSNFITSVMGGHSEISGPPPSHMFRLFGLNCQNYHPTSNDKNWTAFKTDFVEAAKNMIGDWDTTITLDELSAACPNRNISEALSYLYSLERRPEEHISFVKENYTYSIVPFILANWPTAKFIYQVRDPRDVVASWIKTPNSKGGVRHAAETWHRDQTETLNIFGKIQSEGRATRVRYEDLIADVDSTARKLCTHIGVNFEPGMLEFYKDQRIRRNADRVSAWENLARPVLTNNSGKYKTTLTDIDIRYVELSCARLMQTFGYELETDAATLSDEQVQMEISDLRCKTSEDEYSDARSDNIQAIRARRLKLINRVKSRVTAR